jgi:hypothetical protein
MTAAAARRLWRGSLAAALVTCGCTEINTGADHVASLSFDRFPSPAVVAGDTLRDSLGLAAPLQALAYNTAGDVVAGAPIQYVALDTGLTITDGAYVIATRRGGSVALVANAGVIQSQARPLLVTRRPDAVVATSALADTVNYVLPDNPAVNASPGLTVQVITGDSADGTRVTQGWRVAYQAVFRGAAIAPGDTSVAFLVDGTNRTVLDTTDATGTASRRLRVRPIGITVSAVDSVIVTAAVTYRGVPVRGSPVRFVILLQPKQ